MIAETFHEEKKSWWFLILSTYVHWTIIDAFVITATDYFHIVIIAISISGGNIN